MPNAIVSRKDFDNSKLCFRMASIIYARVVEWQTRYFEGVVLQGVRVQLPPRALNKDKGDGSLK